MTTNCDTACTHVYWKAFERTYTLANQQECVVQRSRHQLHQVLHIIILQSSKSLTVMLESGLLARALIPGSDVKQ
jgi:hypothetical protein